MPRLDPLDRDDVPAEAQVFFDRDEARYGTVLNNTRLYAHNLAILRAVKGFVAAFAEAESVPLSLKALIRVRVALINLCPF